MYVKTMMRGASVALVSALAAAAAGNVQSDNCANLPSQAALKSALTVATSAETSGLNNQMWGTIVDRDGIVCAVAFTSNAVWFAGEQSGNVLVAHRGLSLRYGTAQDPMIGFKNWRRERVRRRPRAL